MAGRVSGLCGEALSVEASCDSVAIGGSVGDLCGERYDEVVGLMLSLGLSYPDDARLACCKLVLLVEVDGCLVGLCIVGHVLDCIGVDIFVELCHAGVVEGHAHDVGEVVEHIGIDYHVGLVLHGGEGPRRGTVDAAAIIGHNGVAVSLGVEGQAIDD